MTTTIMRDSIVGDAWIQQTYNAVPPQLSVDPATGAATGDILTGPVRLAFDTLFKLPQATESMPNPKYGAALLFPPFADLSIFQQAYWDVAHKEFPDFYDAATQQFHGLYSPFRDQAEKLKFGGFTPGGVFISSTTKFKPGVVDARGNPIVDESKVYPGVWAVCAVNCYAFKDARKKGIAFGLQSVMIIGDDTAFGGNAPDPNKQFAAVKGAITAPSVTHGQVSSGVAAGNAMTGANAAPPQMPGAPAGGTYAAPQMPGAPAPPQMPGAPAGGTYAAPQMPGAPAPSAPAADPRGPVPAGYASWAEYDAEMADL